MNGERCCIVLGAGASRCYKRGHGEMPLQSDIANKLFMGLSVTRGASLGGFSMSAGLRHSERLAAFLRRHFSIPDPPDDSQLDLWKELQARGYTLESLYAEVQRLSVGSEEWIADEFEAIVRTVFCETVERSYSGVCDLHRALVRALEPGDYIVNFNWDTLISDALYHCTRLWFPITGFGTRVGILGKHAADAVPGQSSVAVIQVHGCVALYTLIGSRGDEQRKAVYTLPRRPMTRFQACSRHSDCRSMIHPITKAAHFERLLRRRVAAFTPVGFECRRANG